MQKRALKSSIRQSLISGFEEFSNIQDLGQIRFPSGNIKAIFEDIRHVLEREGLVDEK